MMEDLKVTAVGYEGPHTNRDDGQWLHVEGSEPFLHPGRPDVLLVLTGQQTDVDQAAAGRRVFHQGRVKMDTVHFALLGRVSEEVRLAVRNFLRGHGDRRDVVIGDRGMGL